MEFSKSFTDIAGKISIGLTGPIASGKSFALKCFEKYGACAISTDEIGHKLLTEPSIFDTISKRYWNTSVLNAGKLDKDAFAELIFSNESERKWLESLLHPEILREAFSLASVSCEKLIVVELPLLFELGLEDKFSLTLCINSEEELLYDRALARGWSRGHCNKRFSSQFSPKQKCHRADLIINNCGTKQAFEEKIKRLCCSIV